MTLTLTLVRHGQTHLNARRMLQGRVDSPLTRTGLAGVRVTAQHLAGTGFDAAYSSPQGRAVATAVEICRHHPQLDRLRADADLREFSFGVWERKPEHELEAFEPWSTLVPGILAGTHPGLPGGESGEAFMARVVGAFDRILAAHPDGHVLVVGHGLTLGAWLAHLDPSAVAALPNASVSTVTVDEDGAHVLEVGRDVAGHGSVAARPLRASAGAPVDA
ncbi:MAG: histidine phosphatase family protein [Cellulomonas sp.]|nr:histidine phosphatase family protein [Cellulomonas sp.]